MFNLKFPALERVHCLVIHRGDKIANVMSGLCDIYNRK